MNEPLIEFQDVSLKYERPRPRFFRFLGSGPRSDSLSVLTGLSFKILRGQFVALLGPSGCGKSSVLKLISGLIQPDSGRVVLSGCTLGSVFQEPTLLPWATAEQNVAMALQFGPQRMTLRESSQRALQALHSLSLEKFAQSLPHQLSGGMKMRVSLARALVTEPNLLLLDEPFAALDEDSRELLQNDLLRLQSDIGLTIVLVTHSLSEAALLAQRCLLFGPHQPAQSLFDSVCSLGSGTDRIPLRLSDQLPSRIRQLRADRDMLFGRSIQVTEQTQ